MIYNISHTIYSACLPKPYSISCRRYGLFFFVGPKLWVAFNDENNPDRNFAHVLRLIESRFSIWDIWMGKQTTIWHGNSPSDWNTHKQNQSLYYARFKQYFRSYMYDTFSRKQMTTLTLKQGETLCISRKHMNKSHYQTQTQPVLLRCVFDLYPS